MSSVYRQSYDENGGVLDPDAVFLDDENTLAGEFNSSLDRDNFAAADIVTGEIDASTGRVFTETGSSAVSDTTYSPTMTTTDWQGGGGNGADGIFRCAWTSTQEAHIDVHLSAEWDWTGAYSYATNGAARPDTRQTYDTLALKITLDGVPIAFGGPWEDGDQYWATFLCGSAQVPAGSHVLTVECEVVRRVWQTQEADGVCSTVLAFRSRAVTILERFR